ncbi:MAG TPA: hypothetical protein VLE96_04530 [Chlamydiales bacterium]|nr:hypothetical protein [Chlamydiales bacterium]
MTTDSIIKYSGISCAWLAGTGFACLSGTVYGMSYGLMFLFLGKPHTAVTLCLYTFYDRQRAVRKATKEELSKTDYSIMNIVIAGLSNNDSTPPSGRR